MMNEKIWHTLRTMLPSILMILTAGWFVGCSSDDEQDGTDIPNDTMAPITFGSMTGNEQDGMTRAGGEPLHKYRKRFRLMGFKHMDDAMTNSTQRQTVFYNDFFLYDAGKTGTTTDNSAGWYYVYGTQGIRYWDFKAKAYRFFAIAGDGTGIEINEGGEVVAREITFDINGLDEDNTTIAPEDKETPLITQQWVKRIDEILAGDAYKSPVMLTFYKPLARVRILLLDEHGVPLKNGSTVVSYISPSSIKFAPTKTEEKIIYGGTGTMRNPLKGYTPGGETLTVTPKPGEVYDAFTTPYEDNTDPADNAFTAEQKRWYHVIENTAQGSFTLSFEYNGAIRSATVPAEYMQWKTGYSYTYAFKISATAVNFDMKLSTMIKWQAGYTGPVVEW